MKILVTGGAGFIGSNFIHHILKKYPEYRIINVDILTYAGNLENLKVWENDERYRFVKGNVTDANVVDPLVAESDVVVHFAAESHVDRSIVDPYAFIDTNIKGTFVLLESARKYNKRFHHISTDEVFGALGPEDAPFDENTKYDPRSPYSASKASSDHLVRSYFHTYDLPVTISNCSNNYGPYHFPEKLIPLAITNLLEGKTVPVYGDGFNVRDWLYVEDHCKAIDLIIHQGIIGETYCIGGASERENIWIVKKLLELLEKDESMIEYVKDRAGHDRRYAINFSKIERELGWHPEVTLEDGLTKTVEWFRENEAWWKNIESGTYKE
ncbi:MAG: dTDP-glucose 4,6-dehydratase [Candidatus Moranbacteria bacterium CG_4_10_14_3_um_filter_45_9]|nr:MAG: dTDP-glucose 4,6-dehydratase [Candidatus Moranbacteria bacterium CG2_30_45_14]PIX90206.1 MAG: dTDP-glucose 4,6-dehydratase [Candidatus Moranbacteria bacterium CG_4_10_14_3_um_filter_45_9]PJA85023.1 MAG: dTDP-glucose 4,6-dehydratase [Candidatus Moranbacteria bacterium CG_4_9_14_3_um_filter_45_14]